MWTGETIRMRHVLTRIFLENGEKKSVLRFQKYPETYGRGRPPKALRSFFFYPLPKINDVENIKRESKKRGRFKRVLL